MKKLFTMMALIAINFGILNAGNYYINTTLLTGANDGSSWDNAFQTFDKAITIGTGSGGFMTDATVDNVFIKGSISKPGSSWTMSVDNYYGSCAGNETDPAQRPMNDNDGNGITESWEFLYPTVYTTNNNGTAINVSTTLLDGFTITQTGTKDNAMMTSVIIPVGGTVQNCVFAGSNLTYTNMATNNGGCLIKNIGTLKSCLIEKNTISITYPATGIVDIKMAPILDINFSATTTATQAVIVSGCIFRNNKALITNTSATAAPDNLRGMILNVTQTNSTATPTPPLPTVTFNNCIVHNNEASYTGSTNFPASLKGSIAGGLGFSANTSTDNYTNCLFANNKTTNMFTCFYVAANNAVVHKGYNNVVWNNQNTVSSTSVTSAVSMGSSSAQNVSAVFSNNYIDVSKTGTWDNGTTIIWNATTNQTNLSKTNSGTNAPYFKKPPMNGSNNVIGANRVGGSADSIAIAQADWRLTTTSSYLYSKGISTSILTDKAGKNYASTPSVGPYEYDASITTAINKLENLSNVFTVATNGVIANCDGLVQVISFSGKTLQNQKIVSGQFISLSQGAYILRLTNNKGVYTQKIVF